MMYIIYIFSFNILSYIQGRYETSIYFFLEGDLEGDLGGVLPFAGVFATAAFAAGFTFTSTSATGLPVATFVRLALSLQPLAT